MYISWGDHSGYGLGPWEKASYHWLSPYPEWSLIMDGNPYVDVLHKKDISPDDSILHENSKQMFSYIKSQRKILCLKYYYTMQAWGLIESNDFFALLFRCHNDINKSIQLLFMAMECGKKISETQLLSSLKYMWCRHTMMFTIVWSYGFFLYGNATNKNSLPTGRFE